MIAPASSNVVRFEKKRKSEAASHDRALARREAELREALADVQALRRQHDRLTRQSGSVVHALYAARETAASRVATLTTREQEVLELVLANYRLGARHQPTHRRESGEDGDSGGTAFRLTIPCSREPVPGQAW